MLYRRANLLLSLLGLTARMALTFDVSAMVDTVLVPSR